MKLSIAQTLSVFSVLLTFTTTFAQDCGVDEEFYAHPRGGKKNKNPNRLIKKKACADLAQLLASDKKKMARRVRKVCESPKFQEGGTDKEGIELKPASEACATTCCSFCPGRPKPEKNKFLYGTKEIVDDEGNTVTKAVVKSCRMLYKKLQEDVETICNTNVEFESTFEQAAVACKSTCDFDCNGSERK
mmetsp:Transcript_21642/g.31595  ORF Transcript_21642/g.31595 Transcript_21642/m.31595 type:complete len:189 (-) Transcript_21642:94-660(-)